MSLVYFILLVGGLIFIHELGHFLFAKLFNVKVLRFSLGFGPRALTYRYGETEYCVSWVPLGGYVKMLGSDPNDEITPQDAGRAFHQKPLWQRYIVVFAGPAFNLVFPAIVFFLFFITQVQWRPAIIGKVFANLPAAAAELQPGDRIIAVDDQEIHYWEQMQRQIWSAPGQRLKLTVERDGQRLERFITTRTTVQSNQLGIAQKVGSIGVTNYIEQPMIGVESPDCPAARAGLQTGDVVRSVNGKPITHWSELSRLLEKNRGESLRITYLRPSPLLKHVANLWTLKPQTTVIDPEAARIPKGTVYRTGIQAAEFYIRSVQPNTPADKLGLKSGDRITHLDGVPLTNWELFEQSLRATKPADKSHALTWVPFGRPPKSANFHLEKVSFMDEYRQRQEHYVFGAQNLVFARPINPEPVTGRVMYATSEAFRQTGQLVQLIALSMVQTVRGVIPSESIGGLLTLYKTAGVAGQKGWDHFLQMMAFISVNLAILNLLPVPVLDGGHILFFTIEAIRRRPLNQRTREVASIAGLALLVMLMVFACRNDIIRYWL